MTSPAPNPLSFAVAVAVGPEPREVDRLIDLADALAAYEPGPAHFVMVDDAPQPRDLAGRLRLPASIVPIALHHPRHGAPAVQFRVGKGICSAVLLAMGWIQQNTPAAFVLKLDTDSLVIHPFRAHLAARFAAEPSLGLVGAYKRTPNDTPRDWSGHAGKVRAFFEPPPFALAHPIASLRRRQAFQPPPMTDVYRAAITQGYDVGEHCMGGGYAVSRTLIDRMRAAGHFAHVDAWTSVDLPEDVMMGLHCRAAGCTLADDVAARAGLFGVRYKGLPFPPQELVEKRYAVIHAVKNDDRLDEATIRAFFADQRRNRIS